MFFVVVVPTVKLHCQCKYELPILLICNGLAKMSSVWPTVDKFPKGKMLEKKVVYFLTISISGQNGPVG